MRSWCCLLLLCCEVLRLTDSRWTGGTPWATPEEEAEDEKKDPQLLEAVLRSVKDWEARHANRTRQKRSESSVCYPNVGCFRDSGYLEMLPSPPEEVATRFLLFSSKHTRRSEKPIIDVAFVNITAIYDWADRAFNVSAPTKVIVHGFGSSCSHVWVYEMRSALMTVEECNVLCVDWENGAKFPNYVRAAANTRIVGRQLSILLSSLRDKHGLDLSNVHIIGFSLGAHAAAFAGAQLGTLSRITGLDPAGPLFEAQEPSERLDSGDASFVDVIHSNGETLILGGLGSWQPMGHVDFYPNGGRMQKGCSNLFVGAFTDILWSGAAIEGRSLCNHRRAYKFFTDSVSPRCPFPAVPCASYEAFLSGECFPCPFGDSCPSMGYYADRAKAEGTLYLATREEEPFCAHQYLARLESTPGEDTVTSYGKIELTVIAEAHINETFPLTQKDDHELTVGESLSRIVVPHPALGRFSSASLLYTAYAGWISSGLAKWSIDKLSLTDSFGRTLSVCKEGLVLESGVSVHLSLLPGDCSRNGSAWTPPDIRAEGNSSAEDPEDNGLETASSEDAARTRNGSRRILLKTEPYRYERVSNEIREPVLAATTPRIVPDADLSPPPMGATESWLHWEQSGKPETESANATLGLFPRRFVAFLEQAERYARSLFLDEGRPLSWLPWLGVREKNENGYKYMPLLDQTTDAPKRF